MKEEAVHQIKTIGNKYIATAIDVLFAKNKINTFILPMFQNQAKIWKKSYYFNDF